MEKDIWWLIVGFAGQALFMMRFVIQWIESERKKRSVIPVAFWYFSVLGGLTLLVYAIHRRDPVFIVGQFLGVFIYLRNLYLIKMERAGANS
ncbi:MAG: hypothetical protein V7642_789 [Burkholderiales bacterium]|jgi:lipid-A-disaccharide synthase-like uncharacterized protein